MKTMRQELQSIAELVCSKDLECKKLGVELFRHSKFIKQFRGKLSCITFAIPWGNQFCLYSYRKLIEVLGSPDSYPGIIMCCLRDNQYKAFINLKNNRIW